VPSAVFHLQFAEGLIDEAPSILCVPRCGQPCSHPFSGLARVEDINELFSAELADEGPAVRKELDKPSYWSRQRISRTGVRLR
jgi:hypothetical protein